MDEMMERKQIIALLKYFEDKMGQRVMLQNKENTGPIKQEKNFTEFALIEDLRTIIETDDYNMKIEWFDALDKEIMKMM